MKNKKATNKSTRQQVAEWLIGQPTRAETSRMLDRIVDDPYAKPEYKTPTQSRRLMQEQLPKLTPVSIFEDYLAGVAYSDYQRVAGIRARRVVEFYWEKSNKFDTNAVKVTLDGVHIGYIPRDKTCHFHVRRELNQKVFGEVVSYNPHTHTHRSLVVRAWYNEEAQPDVAL